MKHYERIKKNVWTNPKKKKIWKIHDLKVEENYLSCLLTTAGKYVARVYSPSRPAYLVPLVSVISEMMFDLTLVTFTRLSYMYNQSHEQTHY